MQEDIRFTINLGEGRSQEFKESLGTVRRDEGIQTLVAFANVEGGRVLFGVADNGSVKGVEIGARTLEDFVNQTAGHTYPSLSTHAEQRALHGVHVLVAETDADRPPIVGCYLYSPADLALDKDVLATSMQAYRRVGRTNQKVDFMSLRQPLASDPNIILRIDGAGSSAGDSFPTRQEFYYSNAGSGWAFRVSFRAEHASHTLEAGPTGITLPPRDQEEPHFRANKRSATVAVTELASDEDLSPAILVANYWDELGFRWESKLELVPTARSGSTKRLYDFSAGRFWRRIVSFPPKRPLS